jgi:hypothetical protein
MMSEGRIYQQVCLLSVGCKAKPEASGSLGLGLIADLELPSARTAVLPGSAVP